VILYIFGFSSPFPFSLFFFPLLFFQFRLSFCRFGVAASGGGGGGGGGTQNRTGRGSGRVGCFVGRHIWIALIIDRGFFSVYNRR